jgi:hypothetical protein
MPTIQDCMADVMADVTYVGKDGFNSQQGFKFRGVDDLVNALGPALRRHRVVVLPELLDSTHDQVTPQSGKVAQRTVVRMKYRFVGPDGDELACSTVGEALDSYDKATTKALSQAYKYALLQVFALPTDEPDPDSFSEPPFDPDANAVAAGWVSEKQRSEAHKALATTIKGAPEPVKEAAKAFKDEHKWPLPLDLFDELDALVRDGVVGDG